MMQNIQEQPHEQSEKEQIAARILLTAQRW